MATMIGDNMKFYQGIPERTSQGGFRVEVAQGVGDKWRPLSPSPSQNLHNHSPDGFAWGYGGSGPAQLALALLLDVTGDADVSLQWYQTFKGEVIAGLNGSQMWELTEDEIYAWLEADTAAQEKTI